MRAVSSRQRAHDDASLLDVEVDPPILEREAHPGAGRANAVVGVRLRAEGKRCLDGCPYLDAAVGEPRDLRVRLVGKADLPRGNRIGRFEPARTCSRVGVGVGDVGHQGPRGRARSLCRCRLGAPNRDQPGQLGEAPIRGQRDTDASAARRAGSRRRGRWRRRRPPAGRDRRRTRRRCGGSLRQRGCRRASRARRI
jgi:hypothetical protein